MLCCYLFLAGYKEKWDLKNKEGYKEKWDLLGEFLLYIFFLWGELFYLRERMTLLCGTHIYLYYSMWMQIYNALKVIHKAEIKIELIWNLLSRYSC